MLSDTNNSPTYILPNDDRLLFKTKIVQQLSTSRPHDCELLAQAR